MLINLPPNLNLFYFNFMKFNFTNLLKVLVIKILWKLTYYSKMKYDYNFFRF